MARQLIRSGVEFLWRGVRAAQASPVCASPVPAAAVCGEVESLADKGIAVVAQFIVE